MGTATVTVRPRARRLRGADGAVLPIEVKFRRRIDDADFAALRRFMERYRCRRGILVTLDTSALGDASLLVVPLRDFLLAY